MLKSSVIDSDAHRMRVGKSKSVTRPKVLTESEATEQLNRIAPDWPTRLYDGAVIDHILKVINEPRRSRTENMRHESARRAAARSRDRATSRLTLGQ
jgi:hypothetical protein